MIVLFGGGGFLGSHMRLLLRRLEHRNVVIVSRSQPKMALSKGERFIRAEEFASSSGDHILRDADALVYLATVSTPGVFADQPWREMTDNVSPAIFQFARLARLNPGAKAIFVSSGGTIYGNCDLGASITEDAAAAPISAYGLGKLAVEQGLQYVHRTTGLRAAILRVSNPVGEYASGGVQGLIPNIFNSLEGGAALTIFGDGGNVRDYVDADDVAEAIWLALRDSRHDMAIWNVGSGVGHSTLDVVAEVEGVTGVKVPATHVPARPVDVRSIILDHRRIATDLGWKPRRMLGHTIRRIWAARTGRPLNAVGRAM